MPTESSTRVPQRLLPLHVTLAAVFVSLFVVFGLALTLFNTLETRRLVLLGAEDLTSRIDEQLRTTVTGLYEPAQGLVDLASKTLGSGTHSLEARLRWLDAFAEALRQNGDLSAIYVGFEDGGFFLVRSLLGRPRAVASLEAPAAAALAVQSHATGPTGEIDRRVMFFSEHLELVGERPLDDAGFDPRQREWYRAAIATAEPVTTGLYVFFTTGETGVSFARRLASGGGVVAVDLSLDDLSAGLARQRVTPGTRIAVFTPGHHVIALSEPELAAGFTTTRPRLDELDDPVYQALAARLAGGVGEPRFELAVEGRRWLVSTSTLPTRTQADLRLATLVPRDEVLAPVDRIRDVGLAISVVLMVLAVAAVLVLSRNVSGSLRALAGEAREIRRFRLSTPLTVTSRIAEVDDLASTMAVMKSTLEQSFAISRALSTEKDPRRLLEMILREARRIANAEGGAILMATDDGSALEVAILEHERTGVYVGGTSGVEPTSPSLPLGPDVAADRPDSAELRAIRSGRSLVLDDLDGVEGVDAEDVRRRFERDGRRLRSLALIPLIDQQGGVVGLLELVDAHGPDRAPAPFDREVAPAIEAIAADAAVALDLRRLLRAQKELLHALIHLLAGAIDAKSPYTHGHCQRVPEIARRLARAAHEAVDGPLAGFHLSDDEWEELYIASWLHDCGKVTTPEYVVDKATRLETLHNRIHEIRTRFEVLWRDAELAYHRAVQAGAPEAEARRELEREHERLREDWEFVAECNLGETFMDDQRLERLRSIGTRTWIRQLDDRLGLSHEELDRRSGTPAVTPTPEPLLADAPHHEIPRPDVDRPFGDNPHGFRMAVPERLYHHGELYNLSIRRGTLTAEERFKINEHIIQTIEMLGQLPFPKELARVPEWAGNHHEKLDGTGYPRRLAAHELSTAARIMAVADVFEALTATDRPYMRPKTLSKALSIMASMCDDGHLDPELFDLLLDSGVYADYGRDYLQPSQLDEIDLAALRRAPSTTR